VKRIAGAPAVARGLDVPLILNHQHPILSLTPNLQPSTFTYIFLIRIMGPGQWVVWQLAQLCTRAL
jgi:hypothetical protein